MCDPATGWFEVAEIKDKTSEGMAKILDQTWFCRYPRPKRCISDNGKEFLGKEFQELLQSYGVNQYLQLSRSLKLISLNVFTKL
jgi:transposase InsO family protein